MASAIVWAKGGKYGFLPQDKSLFGPSQVGRAQNGQGMRVSIDQAGTSGETERGHKHPCRGLPKTQILVDVSPLSPFEIGLAQACQVGACLLHV